MIKSKLQKNNKLDKIKDEAFDSIKKIICDKLKANHDKNKSNLAYFIFLVLYLYLIIAF